MSKVHTCVSIIDSVKSAQVCQICCVSIIVPCKQLFSPAVGWRLHAQDPLNLWLYKKIITIAVHTEFQVKIQENKNTEF